MRPSESFIEQPVRSLQTMLQVIAADDPRLPTLVPDGIYGPDTMNAVSAFQRRQGLPVTGITDQKTWEQVVDAYEPAIIRVGGAEPIEVLLGPGQVLCLGDSNPCIYLLQGMLTQLSHDHTAICPPNFTGVLDDSTADAIKGFQQLAGLPITGELDKNTWRHLSRQFTLNTHINTHRHD